jgi:hypothetical protein
LEQNKSFLTDSTMRTIIKVFLLNREKYLNAFRTLLLNTLNHQSFINFCFPSLRGNSVTNIIYNIFNSIIGKTNQIQFTDVKVKLYLRYII